MCTSEQHCLCDRGWSGANCGQQSRVADSLTAGKCPCVRACSPPGSPQLALTSTVTFSPLRRKPVFIIKRWIGFFQEMETKYTFLILLFFSPHINFQISWLKLRVSFKICTYWYHWFSSFKSISQHSPFIIDPVIYTQLLCVTMCLLIEEVRKLKTSFTLKKFTT